MLEELHLTNFKVFDDCRVPLAPLTLLSGLNGTGKSSVLQVLALLRQSFESGILSEEGWLLNGELVELGVAEDVLHEYSEIPVIGAKIRTSGGSVHRWMVQYERSSDVLRYDEPPDQEGSVSQLSLFGDWFQYLRADRVNPAVSYGKSYHSVGRRHFLGARGEYAAHFLSIFQDRPVPEPLRRRRDDDGDAKPGLLSQVNAWMQEFSPGVRIAVEDIEKTDFVRLSYAYGASAGLSSSGRYRPTNVGFGLSYSLPIVVACLATPPGGLILLENPEAHLHPQGQAAIGRLMALTAATGVQIVVETHSDHVLNGIRMAVKSGELPPDDVAAHYFSRPRGILAAEIHSPKITRQGRLTFWPDGFFDQWDKSLDSLLD
ncbi:MAG: DUF3696 domain-containing protein [Alphaproteobacteria bacterium]|nr:DUF3696 domain-containing protein [Alphaproteobacteria bacterium]